MGNREYAKTGYLKIISMEGFVCCRIDEHEANSHEECVKCPHFNGFRQTKMTGGYRNSTPAIFCLYETDEEKRIDTALRNNQCPTCGTGLIDHIFKEGSHKGHGHIDCPKCQKVIIWI